MATQTFAQQLREHGFALAPVLGGSAAEREAQASCLRSHYAAKYTGGNSRVEMITFERDGSGKRQQMGLFKKADHGEFNSNVCGRASTPARQALEVAKH